MIDEARFSPMLNRRRKTALWTTLVCVGLIVLLGGGIRAAVGIGLLGIAFSWAFGSDYRLLHWLFIVLGLLLLIPAVGEGFLWPRDKPTILKVQTSIVEGDRDMMKTDMSLIVHETETQERRKDQEEYSKDSDQLLKDEQELRSLEAESIFRHVVKNDWGTIVGGLLLLSAGLGLVVGVKPVQQNPRESTQ